MSQVAVARSDFSTDKLTDESLLLCVSSGTLSTEGMLTEQRAPEDSWPQTLHDKDPSVDTGDTVEMPPWLVDVLPRLGELASLQENWDSYGSPPPPLKLMGDALAVVQRAERLLGYSHTWHTVMPTPSIVPLSGGGIQIEWQTPVKELELEFFDERRIVALAVNVATGETTEGAFDASDCDMISALLAWLMSH